MPDENRIRHILAKIGGIMKKSLKIKMVIFPILLFIIILCGNVSADAYSCEQSELNVIALSHLKERVTALEEAIETDADTDTINAKIAELEEAIANAESVTKSYVDTEDETLKNELTAAIASAKVELLSAIDKKADADDVNTKFEELNMVVNNLTNELNTINQKTQELEGENNKLQTVLIIVCVVSGITFCGCGAFAIWFFITRKKNFIKTM